MPKIAIYKYFTFLIVMFDTLGEPPHLHIIKNKSGHKRMAKIWLETLLFAEKGDLTETELTTVEKIVKKNQTQLLKRFMEVRNQEKHKPLNLK